MSSARSISSVTIIRNCFPVRYNLSWHEMRVAAPCNSKHPDGELNLALGHWVLSVPTISRSSGIPAVLYSHLQPILSVTRWKMVV